MQISDNIKRIRKKAGFKSQEGAAEKIGIPRTTFASWENGDAEPSLQMIQRIADVFRVSPLELLQDVLSFDINEIPDQDNEIELSMIFSRSDIQKIHFSLNALGSVFSHGVPQEKPKPPQIEVIEKSGNKKPHQSLNKENKQKDIS